MYGSIRRYKIRKPQEFTDKVNESFINVIRTIPGFISYMAIDEGDGYYFYQLQEQDTRPLDEEDAQLVQANAFADWYELQLFSAQDEGRFSVDESLYEA